MLNTASWNSTQVHAAKGYSALLICAMENLRIYDGIAVYSPKIYALPEYRSMLELLAHGPLAPILPIEHPIHEDLDKLKKLLARDAGVCYDDFIEKPECIAHSSQIYTLLPKIKDHWEELFPFQ